MTSTIPKDRTVEALAAVWSSLHDLLAPLDEDDWSRPTALPGWDVRANIAHIVGTEAMLLGEPNPDVAVDRTVTTHVRNDIGEFNEAWVQALADAAPGDVLRRFDDLTARRLESLRAMSNEEWDAETFTPAGRDSYGRFMQIRVFDCWFHEQDVREAIGRPGHDAGLAVEVTLDEVTTAMGFVVGKRAGAAPGSTVTFDLTGPAARTIHVAVGERATVVDRLDGPAAVTIRVPLVAFTRLCGGRTTLDELVVDGVDVAVDGDEQLGRRILENLAYTI